MESKKFVVMKKRYQGESTILSTRLPVAMIAELDVIAKATGRTRNELIQKSIEFAIDNLEIQGSDEPTK